MNDLLIKVYDVIKEEQRNADSKANLFIVLIMAVITFLGKIPTSTVSIEDISGYQQLLFLMILPLLMLVLSLVPIYRIKDLTKRKPKNDNELNLYYWQTIIGTGTYKDFVEQFKHDYVINSELSRVEKDILEQIYKNADIMDRKATIHKLAFTIIIQFILLFLVSGVTVLVFNSSRPAFWILLALEEVMIYLPFKKVFNGLKAIFIKKT